MLFTDSIEHGPGRKRIRVSSISSVLSSTTVGECTCMPCIDVDPSLMITSSKISSTCRSHRTQEFEGARVYWVYVRPLLRHSRHAQAVLGNVCGVSMHRTVVASPAQGLQYYVRSTKLILPSVFSALVKGSDPDRMKGALYILWSKGIGQVFP